ncbi:MAG: aminopeptidase P family protein [Holophagales bacterium]|nr:aminopeptidase P family protein [Holophagales bacterium]
MRAAGLLVAASLAAASAPDPAVADAAKAVPSASAHGDQGRVIQAPGAVLPMRQRPAAENAMRVHRLETLLPGLMKEVGLDMWLVLNREYAEDPVYFSLVPQPTFAARRTTMLVFHLLDDGTLERLTVNRYPLGDPYVAAWQGGDLDSQWQALGELIDEKAPEKIGINVSRHWPVADGLSKGLHERLLEVLPEGYEERLTSAEDLVIRWVETRTEPELAVYPHVVSLARGVIAEAFSARVITPGVTTTDDVAWFLRERFQELRLPIWFMPYVNAQRPGLACEADEPFCGTTGTIHPGDVLHTDVGICYLALCTDTQEMGYVPRLGESGVPPGLAHALATGNRWQDLLTDAFETGRTGNEILRAALASAAAEGIASSVYTHPLGLFGHAPGPTIGMWDDQDGTPIRGDWPLYPMTGYAIEGNVMVAVPEWDGQLVQIKLEQSSVFDGDSVLYLAGRQTEWHVVR